MRAVDIDAYFERVGFAAAASRDLATLEALHRLHPMAIPFENLSTLLREPIPLDTPALLAKLVARRRGGYCFEHNQLFADVLRTLGFEVTTLAARVVWGRIGQSLGPRTHMVLRVRVGADDYLSDVGFGGLTLTGPLQNETANAPISADVVPGARLPVIWGDPLFQGLHAGVFAALGGLVAYWAILSRTTLGLGVKAVGFNPEAARYTGIDVARSYVASMAIAGTFAGLAGAIDILGWQFRLSTGDIQGSTVGFVGIAVALLGRNTAVGIGLASLVFGALLTGTSSRNLDPDVFSPQLGSSLTLLIQGLVVLVVGTDVLVLWLLGKLRRRPA